MTKITLRQQLELFKNIDKTSLVKQKQKVTNTLKNKIRNQKTFLAKYEIDIALCSRGELMLVTEELNTKLLAYLCLIIDLLLQTIY